MIQQQLLSTSHPEGPRELFPIHPTLVFFFWEQIGNAPQTAVHQASLLSEQQRGATGAVNTQLLTCSRWKLQQGEVGWIYFQPAEDESGISHLHMQEN